ncbi:ABC transporter substrate-binding protein [Marivita sp. XM-24bin2]|jgi:peptide/nickel transport system substrate-binding protein|uniref:ABC transporter substrate-binding protein n=1 Tax=unclassified Marivita TaxID=2632480 RepID=UPI000D79D1C9|nr:ABC transporter substrate-binding protein [Marivita sp. XM-24bin2]MCR9109620.1 ABC transporter substrate-binding protein [Paracoccaceae bacterium]PWL36185.1 MAG: peptide ABC transporter substrate-binding protein [Marivita sp. XM-24bin2]
MKRLLLSGVALIALPAAAYANCPAVTVADPMGVAAGEFPQQYELSAFQEAAGCTMEFSANPEIEALNAQIKGNPDLPPLADRIPAEPLVVIPYESIGEYGGELNVLSNATEAGTSDFLSVRHVSLMRYSDDLQTIVPNVAKSWEWNDDFTQLTIKLREGHKWSDGAPFTSADIVFYHDNLMLDTNIFETPKDYITVAGEPMTVEAPDDTTVIFNLPAPKPGLVAHFATHYSQPFQPKHFLGQFHPDVNPDADAYAQSLGFENGYDAILAYYGNSDWTDTPTPMLSRADIVDGLPKATYPTLESHIYISDTTEGRKLVANPYFFQVDSTGQQLPYISTQDELYINDNEVRILKLVNGEVDYKSQSLQLASAPILLENQEKGDYTIHLRPEITMGVFGFNVTHEDPAKREVFGNLAFREAMSVAINRAELNEIGFFGQGTPQQYVGFSPLPEFVDQSWLQYKAEYDPEAAKAALDEIGMVDTDGDGFRELPNGDKLVLNLNFSTQGIAGQTVELVAQNWADVGIQSVVKEVTPDEYRSAQSSNQLDVVMWRKSQPLAIVLGNNELWVPPYENYFGVRNAMLWAEWIDSDGAAGVEPPQWAKDMIDDINALQSAAQGTPEFEQLASDLVSAMVENMMFIGTVNAPAPIYQQNKLKNFADFKTHSYEYYRTYPYRATQWWLDE